MVKKPNGKYRFCIDYRKVNAVTKKDAYPIPNMTGILDELRQANYISTLDLSQAYWQVPMAPASREVTAFVVPGRGLFQFKRMPYGLTNAPATFQRMLDRLIGAEMYPHVFVYLDDIIIISRTFEEHLTWLRKVLEKISKAGLAINREKSEFCRSQVRYLGFLVNSQGLEVDPEKTAPVLNFPAPKNIRQLRRFLGMASWYRRFIPEFATVAEPLTRLTKKSTAWSWEAAQQEALDVLKLRLTSAPTLACPDFSLPFTLQTDASGVGLGAVLTQAIDGHERVIAYASRALSEPEKKYSVTEQECLAVLWSIRKFRCYLEGYAFTVVTDHSSLRWLHNLKNPTGRLARWALELMEYDFVIVHRKGALHYVPDALSRIPEGHPEAVTCLQETQDAWYRRKIRDVTHAPDRFPDWKVVEEKLYFHRPSGLAEAEMEDLDAWKLVLPRESRPIALQECHALPQAGHLGVEKTYRRLANTYYWPNLFKDVVTYVRQCDTCQRCTVEQRAPAGLMGHRVIEEPWMMVATDIMGPVTPSSSGHAYVLVAQDLYTKWIEVQPLRKANGRTIAKALDELVVTRWGAPRVLHTDNGTEFVNRDIRQFTERVGMRHSTTPPYHPQANPTERVNRVVKTMIRAFLGNNHREWDQYLHEFRFAYNTAYHSSLQATPAFANFGREPPAAPSLRRRTEGATEITPRPVEDWLQRMARLDTLRKAFTHALDEAFRRQAGQYKRHHRDQKFAVGELVLRRTHRLSSAAKHITAALLPPFEGPYVITKQLSRVVFELSDLDGRSVGKTSVKDLKPYETP